MTEPLGSLYLQVAEHIRERISAGELAIGDPIPSTRQLCTEFGVSATVARAAVRELQSEGLVIGQPGKAVYVIATPAQVEADGADLHALRGHVRELQRQLTELYRLTGNTPT